MKKKILYIHHGKGLGGAPISLATLISGLDRTKYDPAILFLHKTSAVDLFKDQDIPLYGPVDRYDFPHTKIWWLAWYHLPMFLRVLYDTLHTLLFDAPHWLDIIKPDLVHLNTSSLIAWGMAAQKKKIPVVWHIREPLASGYFGIRKKTIQNIIQKTATAIVPISRNDAQPWIDDPKTTVLHNPVDTDLFFPALSGKSLAKRLGIPPHAPTILFLGGVAYEKGTDIILTIFSELLKTYPHAYLIIAGNNPLEEKKIKRFSKFSPHTQYLAAINQLCKPIEKNVIFTGPSREIPELIALSSVLVFPAPIGHFARPIIEAACMAKPVIASNIPPLTELVVDQKTGFLLDPHDIDAWIERLSTLFDTPALAQKMGADAYKASKPFHLSHYKKRIDSLYDSLLKGSYEQKRSA